MKRKSDFCDGRIAASGKDKLERLTFGFDTKNYDSTVAPHTSWLSILSCFSEDLQTGDWQTSHYLS